MLVTFEFGSFTGSMLDIFFASEFVEAVAQMEISEVGNCILGSVFSLDPSSYM